MADITGKYQLESSENFEEYMKAIGVNFVLRKLASAMSSATVDVTKSGSEYSLKTTTTAKTSEVKFELDKSVSETTMDGRQVKSVFTLEGNTLKQHQTGDAGFETTIDREFTPQGLTATIKFKDVTAIRKYKKL